MIWKAVIGSSTWRPGTGGRGMRSPFQSSALLMRSMTSPMVTAAAVMGLVALLAVFVPVSRATRVNPVRVLRSE